MYQVELWDIIMSVVLDQTQMFKEIDIGSIIKIEFNRKIIAYSAIFKSICKFLRKKDIITKKNILIELMEVTLSQTKKHTLSAIINHPNASFASNAIDIIETRSTA